MKKFLIDERLVVNLITVINAAAHPTVTYTTLKSIEGELRNLKTFTEIASKSDDSVKDKPVAPEKDK